MKQDPDWQQIQENMRPGVITLQGFLGQDGRDLVQIIDEDAAVVHRLALTHEAIAARMAELRDVGTRGLGEFIDVPPHFAVRVDSVRGRLRCPFGEPGLTPKTNITVKNLATGREITFTDLNIHCIREHGFYQGRGSVFRIDPAVVAEILEMPRG
jgi:hypothetical protein